MTADHRRLVPFLIRVTVNSVEMNSADSPDCNPQPQEEDPLLKFIDYSRSALSPEADEDSDQNGNGAETCSAYSRALQRRFCSPISHRPVKKMLECVKQLQKKNKRRKHSNTVTIDSIYKKNFLSLNSVLEAGIVDVFVLPGNLVTEEL